MQREKANSQKAKTSRKREKLSGRVSEGSIEKRERTRPSM